jgi:hypothetical protein
MLRLRLLCVVAPLTALAITWVREAAAQQITVPRVTRLGSDKAFGPGIVAASAQRVRFAITRPAHLIVLRIHPDGSIEPLLPQRPHDPTDRAAGEHVVEAPPPTPTTLEDAPTMPPERVLSRGALERAGQRVQPPAAGPDDSEPSPASYWWLVMVSDTPTSLEELRSGLESFQTRTFTSVEASVRAMPRQLVANRKRTWAAYYSPVEP